MKTISTLHAPMRIMGIQAKCDLVDVHGTLANLWTRWVDDKAARLPSFTLTVYCVYQYHDAEPNKVLITLGRIVAQDLPEVPFARETLLPAQDYYRYDLDDMQPENRFATWQLIEQNDELERSFTTDFETHSVNGSGQIYVGKIG